jgi:hypothetical protein
MFKLRQCPSAVEIFFARATGRLIKQQFDKIAQLTSRSVLFWIVPHCVEAYFGSLADLFLKQIRPFIR